MNKVIGILVLSLIGLALTAFAQVAPAPVAAAAPVVAAPAAAVPADITIKGEVSVVKGPDGAAQVIFINPAEGHGYKVDLVNGEGKTLADKDGKIVEATGVDANRLFNIKTVTVVQ